MRSICSSRSRSREDNCWARAGARNEKRNRVAPKAKATVRLKGMAASVNPAQVQEWLATCSELIRIKPILYKLRYKQKKTLLSLGLTREAAGGRRITNCWWASPR